jgi:heme/copper-type cytochrome/quinol oxidase subunit 2
MILGKITLHVLYLIFLLHFSLLSFFCNTLVFILSFCNILVIYFLFISLWSFKEEENMKKNDENDEHINQNYEFYLILIKRYLKK